MHPLQDRALLAFTALSCQQSSTGGAFKDFANSLVGLGRALEVFVGPNLLADFLTLDRSGQTCYSRSGWASNKPVLQ